MKSVHLMITGRVQGVGFRDWMVGEATSRQLSGWVRNVGQDQVEAMLAGLPMDVDECVQLCRQGPRAARVDNLVIAEAASPEQSGFLRRDSAGRA